MKTKPFQVGDYVLLYDSKYLKHLGKLQMHWLDPYQVKSITNGDVVTQIIKAGCILQCT